MAPQKKGGSGAGEQPIKSNFTIQRCSGNTAKTTTADDGAQVRRLWYADPAAAHDPVTSGAGPEFGGSGRGLKEKQDSRR